jgi:DNA-binding transcriptional ArsR family regulator
MFIVKKHQNKIESLPAKEVNFKQISSITSELSYNILKELAKEPAYPSNIAKNLKVHEQKVYYHIRNLEKAGIIRVLKRESKQGATANFYTLVEPAIVLMFKELQETRKLNYLHEAHRSFLEPFIKEGQLNALIVVGSPDPHGPEKARARDGYYGIDFALFLGTFLNYVPKSNVRLDTEIRQEDLDHNNMIIIGGPITNKVMDKVNDHIPIRFTTENGKNIHSDLSSQNYVSEEVGMIVKAESPFNPRKKILVLAGKKYIGTRAAILAFLEGFGEICKGNIHNKDIIAKVVEGIDLDSDGIIDSIEFRE